VKEREKKRKNEENSIGSNTILTSARTLTQHTNTLSLSKKNFLSLKIQRGTGISCTEAETEEEEEEMKP
jgi:hypothetical protein